MKGETPEITELLQFEWYELVWYHDPGSFPEQKRKLGCWVGTAEGVGQKLTYWILTEKCSIIARSSVHSVRPEEGTTTEFIADQLWLDAAIQEKIGDQVKEEDISELLPGEDTYNFFDVEDDGDDEVKDKRFDRPEADEFTADTMDTYLRTKVLLPRGQGMFKGTVVGRRKGINGNPLGTANSNPILDTREYEVQFPDGSLDNYTADMRLCSCKTLLTTRRMGQRYQLMVPTSQIAKKARNGDQEHKDGNYLCNGRMGRHPGNL
jgi:hypothetical protein